MVAQFNSSLPAYPFPQIDEPMARRQLEYFGHKRSENVYLRFFYHSNDPRKDGDKGRKLDRLRWKDVENYQRDGRGVYVVVNGAGGGHEDKDIKQCVAIFCEWDDRPVEDQLLHWETVGFLEPTFTVYSGDKSAQPYWIFDTPISVEQWRNLQLLLIEVMGADPANKNPSRVFRLAGGWHVKPGREPQRAEIVQESGIKYSYEQLRDRLLELKAEVIPASLPVQPPLKGIQSATESDIVELIGGYIPLKQCGSDWKGDCPFCNAVDQFIVKPRHQAFECLNCKSGGDGDNYCNSAADFLKKYQRNFSGTSQRIRSYDIQVPVPESVPLEVCLSKNSQHLLQSGASEGGRNANGAKLARDLIGTANHLQRIGQRLNGDPWQLFLDYCHRCPTGNGWGEGEWKNIWRSAQSDRPTPSCKAEGVETCIRAWYWNNHVKPSLPTRDHPTSVSGDGGSDSGNKNSGSSGDRVATIKKISLLDAAEQAKSILQAKHTELIENIELEKVREDCGMSGYDWERKIIKPLKRDLNAERFKFDLLNLLAIDDEVERIRQQALLAPQYQMTAGAIERALELMKQRTSTLETQWFGLDEFLDLKSEGLRFVIPELLPVGETIILAGAPKSGKTLLAIDAAFAVATGECAFLKEQVTTGRVLIVSVDESAHSTKAKLLKRGFRREDAQNVQVMTKFDIRQIRALEERLETFRPTLVIIDSLKRITHGQEVSENSAEFADNIYTLKESLTRYGAAGILIHHTNKSQDALGVGKIRGSSAIAGAVWGTWQLDHIPKPDPNNKKKLIIDPSDPRRILSVFARDTEGQQLRIELDLEDNSWTNHGGVGDSEEWEQERKTLRVRITEVLTRNSHLPGLSGREIIELMGMTPEQGRSVYSELNRMVGKRLLSCRPAPGDKRYNIYSLPNQPPSDDPTPPLGDGGGQGGSDPSSPSDFSHHPPSPTRSDSVAEYSTETKTQQEFPIVSKLVSNYSADSQQPVEDTPPADYSKPVTENVLEIVSNPESETGGGCVEVKAITPPHPQPPEAPAPTEAPALGGTERAIAPPESLLVGDSVIVDSPGLKHHGKQGTIVRLKTECFQGQELQLADLSVPGERRYVEVQLSWLCRVKVRRG